MELQCFYSLSSPWMYLGGPRLEEIVKRFGVRLILKPYDFQSIAATVGSVPLRTRPEPRKTYHADELRRWSDHLGMPINLKPKHYKPNYAPEVPVDPNWNKYAGWMVIAAQREGRDAFRLSHSLLRALWAEERDITRAEVRVDIANAAGYDGPLLQTLEAAAETLAEDEAFTKEAESAGVFGAPTIVFPDGERFWGQDRFDFVERKLEKLLGSPDAAAEDVDNSGRRKSPPFIAQIQHAVASALAPGYG